MEHNLKKKNQNGKRGDRHAPPPPSNRNSPFTTIVVRTSLRDVRRCA